MSPSNLKISIFSMTPSQYIHFHVFVFPRNIDCCDGLDNPLLKDDFSYKKNNNNIALLSYFTSFLEP